MGFSLKRFFEELEDILVNADLDPAERLTLIEDLVEREKKYADECGQLR